MVTHQLSVRHRPGEVQRSETDVLPLSFYATNLVNCTCIYKKDGYRQRNMRQFLHILASLGYAPGTIAVNVTWMETGKTIQC